MELRINELTTDIFLNLYTSAGWEPPCERDGPGMLKMLL